MSFKWYRILLLLITPVILAGDIRELTPRLIDHGDLRMGVILEDTIRFINSGSEELIIARLQSTCGCTALSAGPMKIQPGDTAVIPYFFNTRGFKGVLRKTIKVIFKNHDPAALSYTFQVNVVLEIAVEPKYFYLPCLTDNADTTIVRIFKVGNFSEHNIKIRDVQTPIDQLKVFPAGLTLKPGRWYTFKIHFRPHDVPDGNWAILLHTDYEPFPEIKVPFYVTFVN